MEMFDRSQAFAAYKALNTALDRETEKKRREEAKLAEIGDGEGTPSTTTIFQACNSLDNLINIHFFLL